MLPWVCGFTWSAGHLIFLGIFFSVVLIILSTVMLASLRSVRDFKQQHLATISWEVDFEDLPASTRHCRHEFTGEFKQRICNLGFDCRECSTHAKLIAAARPLESENNAVCGIEIPDDRLYHRGHTWVQPQSDGSWTIGLDEFGSRLIGSTESVELPAVGSRLQVNGLAWRFRKAGSEVRILSPVDGEVVETGGSSSAWYVRVKPASQEVDTRHLLRGAEVQAWMVKEMERLELALSPEGVGVALADGGTLLEDVPKACPEADWDAVWGDTFLQP